MSEQNRRHPNVVNLSELEAQKQEKGKRFGSAFKPLGAATGARGIGCSWYEVPPGRTAYPAHYHCANEEAVFILEGEGTLRIGNERVAIRPGDYMTFPTGPDTAHQLLNTGTVPLRYLALSTLNNVDVVGYPDSGKLGAIARPPGKGWTEKPWVRSVLPMRASVDYYDGEQVD
jgi:uncharacterized cupin superfamily protein